MHQTIRFFTSASGGHINATIDIAEGGYYKFATQKNSAYTIAAFGLVTIGFSRFYVFHSKRLTHCAKISKMKGKETMKKSFIATSLILALVFSLCSIPAQASAGEIVSYDEETGITVYRDAAGGIVLSGLPTVYTASKAEQATQLATINTKASSDEAPFKSVTSNRSRTNYVDYENNPIYIGTWSGAACYARHTLGSYNPTLRFLTSYGYVSWYNTAGNTAVPYRNGNATVSSQAVVDVAKRSFFDIRDLDTDEKLTLRITDWGPNQVQTSLGDGCERIADLDRTDFSTLHGNYTDGILYARTWVPIINYNP